MVFFQDKRSGFTPIQNNRCKTATVFYILTFTLSGMVWYRKTKILNLVVMSKLWISSLMYFWHVAAISRYLNFAVFLKDLLSLLWVCPAFWWWDVNIHLDFFVFYSRSTILLASNRFLTSFTVLIYSSIKLT